MTALDERYMTRREAEVILENGRLAYEAQIDSHLRVHQQDKEALVTALAATDREHALHVTAHDAAHVAHEKVHEAEGLAVVTALENVGKERDIHAAAHEREHLGHLREHGMADQAITKAEAATEIRFHGVNEFRDQLREQQRLFATSDRLEVLSKETDRRMNELARQNTAGYEQNRTRIEALEKGDVKQEGRGAGQAGLIAAVVAIIGTVATLLSIVVIVSNILAK